MLRKVLSVVTVIVALILLFLLVRTLVHTFSSRPRVTPPSKPQVSTSQPAKPQVAQPTAPAKTSTPEPAPTPMPTPVPSANPGTSATDHSTNLSNTGPGDTAMIVLAGTATIGTMYFVRRKQLSNL